MTERTINAIAPIRICDIGGWTDTWFAKHGAIFNIGVYPYAEVQIRQSPRSGSTSQVTIYPIDFESPYLMGDSNNSRHPLLESAIRRIGIPANSDIFVSIHSEAPAGASTGTSAAVTVALVGALNELNGGHLTPLEIAKQAHRVETDDLHQQSGIQDQIAAALGGVNFIDMNQYPDDYRVDQLSLPDKTWWELERRLCLVFLGRRHTSSDVHQQVIRHLESDQKDAQALLAPLRQAAIKARAAIVNGDFISFGKAARENNRAQRRLHPDLICPDADKIASIAADNGAIGWKVNGAGGDGGSMTLICGPDMAQKRQMINAIHEADPNFSVIKTFISRRGVRVWDDRQSK